MMTKNVKYPVNWNTKLGKNLLSKICPSFGPPEGDGKFREHCPSCKQEVGTKNENCTFKETKLHSS